MTFWRTWQEWHCTNPEGEGKQLLLLTPFRCTQCFPPLWFTSTCSAESRCLPQACTQCLFSSSHTPAESGKGTWCTEAGLEDLLSQPQQARGSEKEQPKREQFYEWLLGVLGKKNYNLSCTQLLNPLLYWIHKMYGIFKSELCPSIFQDPGNLDIYNTAAAPGVQDLARLCNGLSPGKTLKKGFLWRHTFNECFKKSSRVLQKVFLFMRR